MFEDLKINGSTYDINDTSATRHMMYRSVNPWWQVKIMANDNRSAPNFHIIQWNRLNESVADLDCQMQCMQEKCENFYRITTLCFSDEIGKWAHVQGYNELQARIDIFFYSHRILQINEYINDNNTFNRLVVIGHSTFDTPFRELIQLNRFREGQILSE